MIKFFVPFHNTRATFQLIQKRLKQEHGKYVICTDPELWILPSTLQIPRTQRLAWNNMSRTPQGRAIGDSSSAFIASSYVSHKRVNTLQSVICA